MSIIDSITSLFKNNSDPKEEYRMLYKQYVQAQIKVLEAGEVDDSIFLKILNKREKLRELTEKAAKKAGEDFGNSFVCNFSSDETQALEKRVSEKIEEIKAYKGSPDANASELEFKFNQLDRLKGERDASEQRDLERLKQHLASLT